MRRARPIKRRSPLWRLAAMGAATFPEIRSWSATSLRSKWFALEPVARNIRLQVRVRAVKQLANDMLFDVAVELEMAQDIWGIVSVPEDWAAFPKIEGLRNSARELQIVPRVEANKALDQERTPTEPVRLFWALESDSISPLPPLLAQLAANLREETGTRAATKDRIPIGEDADESLREFCSEVERKAMKVFGSLVKAFAERIDGSIATSERHSPSDLSPYARGTGHPSRR